MSPAPKKPAPPAQQEDSVVDGIETEGWRPEPGEEITGTVVAIGAGHSDFRARTGPGAYPIITVAVSNEHNLSTPEEPPVEHDPPREVAVHAFQAVLYNELLTQRPEIGEKLTITFGGKRQHKTIASQSVAVYKVRVHREGDGTGWDDLFGAPPGRQVATVAVDAQTGELLDQPDGADHPF